MGRNRRWKSKKKNKGEQRKDEPYDDGYITTILDHGNFKMEAYYALQGMHDFFFNTEGQLVPCRTDEEKERERLRWRSASQEILPSSFRIASDVPESLQERLEKELEDLVPASEKLMKKLQFLPRAFQLNMDKKSIRKTPSLQKLHLWLKQQTMAGFITRQETVSMIPPVVLAPNPNDSVLDMCASPGSKSSQLLEKLNKEGCMVANDASAQRAFMLVHQLRRIMHLNPVVLITCCEAQFFPQTLTFKRILSDVPCSGDGTSRKNAAIWKDWNQLGALGLHVLQLDIAWKGAALLEVDGYMCYSTCSYNPMENEAVVAELLRRGKGSLELVECSLDGFKTRPGWSSWKVLCEDQSKREVKDKLKKNNSKMQRKRKEWEKGAETAAENEQTDREEDDRNIMNVKNKNSDVKIDDTDQAKEIEKKEFQDEDVKKKEMDKNRSAEEGKNDDNKAENTKDEEITDKGDNNFRENRDDEIDENNTATDGKKDDLLECIDNEENTNGNSKGQQGKFRRYAATSWDETTLAQLAESAGLREYKSLEDVPKKLTRRIRVSCFPPTSEEVGKFHLERCIRCLSQDNDTGGFFVALLKKVAPISAKERKCTKTISDDSQTNEPELKRIKPNPDGNNEAKDTGKTEVDGGCKQVEPDKKEKTDDKEEKETSETTVDGGSKPEKPIRGRVKGAFLKDSEGRSHKDLGKDDFVPVDSTLFEPLIDYYGLAETFPQEQYMARACGDAKVLYFIGKSVKNMIDLGIQKRVTIINSGVKGFVRNNKYCEVAYRVAQEGVHFLAPHMTKRKVVASFEDYSKCLSGEGSPIGLDTFSTEFSSAIRPLSVGSVIVMLKGYEENYGSKMILTMWRCRSESINCLVSKAEIDGMRSKLDGIHEKNKHTKAN